MPVIWKKHREYTNAQEAWDGDRCLGTVSYSTHTNLPWYAKRNGIDRGFDWENRAKEWVEKPGLDGIAYVLLVTDSLPVEDACGSVPPVMGRIKNTSDEMEWVGGPYLNGEWDALVLATGGKPLLLGCFYVEPGGGCYMLRDSVNTWLQGIADTHLLKWAENKGHEIVFLDADYKVLTPPETPDV